MPQLTGAAGPVWNFHVPALNVAGVLVPLPVTSASKAVSPAPPKTTVVSAVPSRFVSMKKVKVVGS